MAQESSSKAVLLLQCCHSLLQCRAYVLFYVINNTLVGYLAEPLWCPWSDYQRALTRKLFYIMVTFGHIQELQWNFTFYWRAYISHQAKKVGVVAEGWQFTSHKLTKLSSAFRAERNFGCGVAAPKNIEINLNELKRIGFVKAKAGAVERWGAERDIRTPRIQPQGRGEIFLAVWHLISAFRLPHRTSVAHFVAVPAACKRLVLDIWGTFSVCWCVFSGISKVFSSRDDKPSSWCAPFRLG